jgi:hypothetical protein
MDAGIADNKVYATRLRHGDLEEPDLICPTGDVASYEKCIRPKLDFCLLANHVVHVSDNYLCAGFGKKLRNPESDSLRSSSNNYGLSNGPLS